VIAQNARQNKSIPAPTSLGASLSQSILRTHVALVRMVGDSKSVSGT
jgi:hypothetical protein